MTHLPQYNNSAGRILEVFSRLGKQDQRQTATRAEFASALGVPDTWPKILTGLTDLDGEHHALVEAILQVEGTPQFHLYRKSVEEVRETLNSVVLHMPDNQVMVHIKGTATFSLEFVAAHLPTDRETSEDDLVQIYKLCDELRELVDNTPELSRTMRIWILELIRMIRDSLDRYSIRGSRGMHNQLAKIAGELALNWDTANELKEKQPTLWQKLTQTMDHMNTVATFAENCGTAITFAQLSLPLIGGV